MLLINKMPKESPPLQYQNVIKKGAHITICDQWSSPDLQTKYVQTVSQIITVH